MAIDSARWRQITAVFDAALAAPFDQRGAVLAQLCGSDVALRAEVERLLAADLGAADFLAGRAALPAELGATQAAPAPASFGRYQARERIGRGGFGEVFRGFDPTLKRDVAIKTCWLEDRVVRERFAREAEISAPLDHPNITTVHDFGTEQGVPYLVQEFLSGEDLQALIARRAPIPVKTRLAWLAQAARGLAHAHHRGVVHRDIKPSNLRIQQDGSLKILDFGIARNLAATTALTQVGAVVGTLAYMAPEQLRGEAVGQSADLYALGVVAYELLTYRRPFQADSGPALLYAVLHSAPESLTTVWPRCPPTLARLVESCLSRAAERRPADAGALAAQLEAIAGTVGAGEVPEIPPKTAVRAPMSRLQRHALRSAAAALALFAGWLFWPTRGPKSPPRPVPAAPVALGLIMIDARPWGEVVSIRDGNGTLVPLPAQRQTPLAVALIPGEYALVLRAPDGASQRACEARLPAGSAVACSVEFERRDAREFLARMDR